MPYEDDDDNDRSDDEFDVRQPRGELSQDDKQMAMIAHFGGLAGFIIPLIIWLVKKDTSPYVDEQGKEALNFHLTMLIGHFLGMATICFTFGLLSLAVVIVSIIFSILGGIAASRGEHYRYPISIRFIR